MHTCISHQDATPHRLRGVCSEDKLDVLPRERFVDLLRGESALYKHLEAVLRLVVLSVRKEQHFDLPALVHAPPAVPVVALRNVDLAEEHGHHLRDRAWPRHPSRMLIK